MIDNCSYVIAVDYCSSSYNRPDMTDDCIVGRESVVDSVTRHRRCRIRVVVTMACVRRHRVLVNLLTDSEQALRTGPPTMDVFWALWKHDAN